MPVWLWAGRATMFVSALHIIIDFGVGLFDLHGTLSVTAGATLVGVALIQVLWAISFMAGAPRMPAAASPAASLGARLGGVTNGFPRLAVFFRPCRPRARVSTECQSFGCAPRERLDHPE